MFRISSTMTVKQLQEECIFRGVKGHYGKSKNWLLEQLGVGSLWHSQNQPAGQEKGKPRTSASISNSSKDFEWSQLPRVHMVMTLAELSREFLARHPDKKKGISHKKKAWFLQELGEGSIWTCSPYMPKNIDLSKAPRVTKSMTRAQLMEERLARWPDNSKGLSNKSKDELLQLLGCNSIWSVKAAAALATTSSGASAVPASMAYKKRALPTTTVPKQTFKKTKQAYSSKGWV